MTDRAISINQPWAWCIVNGYKPVENRDWPTKRRERIMIHAGKKFDWDGYDWIRFHFKDIPLPEEIEGFDMGGIVGEATITDCVTESKSKWFFGIFGFLLVDAKPCELKPCKGALGFFKPDFNSRYVEKKK